VPVSRLRQRPMAVRLVSDAKLEGMVPVKLLPPRASLVRRVNDPKLEGMVPVKPRGDGPKL
jgi:hypothetical protein